MKFVILLILSLSCMLLLLKTAFASTIKHREIEIRPDGSRFIKEWSESARENNKNAVAADDDFENAFKVFDADNELFKPQLPTSWNPRQWSQQQPTFQANDDADVQALFNENTPERVISIDTDENNCTIKVTEKTIKNMRLRNTSKSCPVQTITLRKFLETPYPATTTTEKPKTRQVLPNFETRFHAPTSTKNILAEKVGSEVDDLLNVKKEKNIDKDDDDQNSREPLDKSNIDRSVGIFSLDPVVIQSSTDDTKPLTSTSTSYDNEGCQIETITSKIGALTKVRKIKTCPVFNVRSQPSFLNHIYHTTSTTTQPPAVVRPVTNIKLEDLPIAEILHNGQPINDDKLQNATPFVIQKPKNAISVQNIPRSDADEMRSYLKKEILKQTSTTTSTAKPTAATLAAPTFKNLTFEPVDALATHELPNLPHYSGQPSLNPLSSPNLLKKLPSLTLSHRTTVKPLKNDNPIDSFLALLGLLSADITNSKNGEFIKTIIDDNGRVLTVSLLLSTVRGLETQAPKQVIPIR